MRPIRNASTSKEISMSNQEIANPIVLEQEKLSKEKRFMLGMLQKKFDEATMAIVVEFFGNARRGGMQFHEANSLIIQLLNDILPITDIACIGFIEQAWTESKLITFS